MTWRYSDDYCGWAPLPPGAIYRAGVGFFYNGVAVGVGFDFGLGANFFTFVPTRNFYDPHPWRYHVAPREVTQIYTRTTVINNFDVDRRNRGFINHGIDPGKITAVTRTEIHPVSIRDTTGPVARGEQLGRDGRTLMVNRPRFADNPPPANRGAGPRPTSPAPGVGSQFPPPRNGNGNNNAQPPRRDQPAPPAPAPAERQIPPVITPSSPGRNGTPAPVAPAPNNNSTDTRRYPSPRMQQDEQQNPRVNPGNNPGGRIGAPATPPAPPVERPAPAQPPPRSYNYVSPRTATPPSESRPNYSPPPAPDNPARNAPAPSSPPAQSQRSGGNKNQNGQQ